MEVVGRLSGGLLFDPVAEFPVGGGPDEHAAKNGTEVQSGPTGKERNLAAGVDIGSGLAGEFDVVGDVASLVRVKDIDEVVRDAAAFIGGGFGGADVHAAIERHRVERKDFGVDAAGEFDGEGRLSDGGGSGNKPAPLQQP